MRVTDYSKAVSELIRDGMTFDTALTNLKRMLQARGHTRLYRKILTLLIIDSEKEEKENAVTLILAHKEDEAKYSKEIKEARTMGNTETHQTRIDQTIIGGFIIQGGQQRIDQSYKRRLLTLYRSLTQKV